MSFKYVPKVMNTNFSVHFVGILAVMVVLCPPQFFEEALKENQNEHKLMILVNNRLNVAAKSPYWLQQDSAKVP